LIGMKFAMGTVDNDDMNYLKNKHFIFYLIHFKLFLIWFYFYENNNNTFII
jgi:hypothetical protein